MLPSFHSLCGEHTEAGLPRRPPRSHLAGVGAELAINASAASGNRETGDGRDVSASARKYLAIQPSAPRSRPSEVGKPSSDTNYSLPGVLTPGGNANLATTVTYTGSWAVTSVAICASAAFGSTVLSWITLTFKILTHYS